MTTQTAVRPLCPCIKKLTHYPWKAPCNAPYVAGQRQCIKCGAYLLKAAK